MGILRAVVGPSSRFPVVAAAEVFQGRTVRAKAIGDEDIRSFMLLERFPEEFEGRLAIPRLGHEALQHLALMIDGAPEIVLLAVDLHEHLVEAPAPVAESPHPVDALAPDLRR